MQIYITPYMYIASESKALGLGLDRSDKLNTLDFWITTSAYVDRFTEFFHCHISEEILYTNIIKILHLT